MEYEPLCLQVKYCGNILNSSSRCLKRTQTFMHLLDYLGLEIGTFGRCGECPLNGQKCIVCAFVCFCNELFFPESRNLTDRLIGQRRKEMTYWKYKAFLKMPKHKKERTLHCLFEYIASGIAKPKQSILHPLYSSIYSGELGVGLANC